MLTEVKTATTAPIHNFFRGDIDTSISKIVKKGANQIRNKDIKPALEWISIHNLVPLESQRVTKQKWTDERIIALDGLDMWALGTLSVCRDPRDQVNYVWDGCGRLALAQLYAASAGLNDLTIPCVVVEGNKEAAAFYFGYCQDSTQGRRTLSKEVLFVNRWYSGDDSAVKEGKLLTQLGLFIKGDTDMPVPQPVDVNAVEIGYRAFAEGMKIGKGDISLVRQARDMIVIAWNNNPNGIRTINQDIFWALIMLLRLYPECQKNGMNRSLQKFLNYVAIGKDQKKVKWKETGLSGNSGIAGQLAYGLLKAWRNETSFFPKGGANVLTYKRLEQYIDVDVQDDND